MATVSENKNNEEVDLAAAFFVECVGQIEKADFGDTDELYCRYAFHFGPDWTIVAGIDSGLSQIARKKGMDHEASIIWNFPIDTKFKSTNPFGWPRIAISVYGIDFWGRDVVRGYGSALVPLAAGNHVIDLPVYVPLSSSILSDWASWLWGNPPEFFDSKFVCQSDGREVTRVKTTGTVRLKLNINTKGVVDLRSYTVIAYSPELHHYAGLDAVGYSVRENN